MSMKEANLRGDERAAYALRALYAQHGYSRFKMGKFEEYELYLRNKDFLAGERMISFTDGDGSLLALKPDVTISIIKNSTDGDKGCRKVYYEESVYRTGRGEARFREIMQAGLECIGALDDYQVFEVIALAIESLARISPDYMLDISHMGLMMGLMEQAGVAEADYDAVLQAVREKNATTLLELAKARDFSEESVRILRLLADTYGCMKTVLDRIEPLCTTTAARAGVQELRVMERLLAGAGLDASVQIDFSVVNDMGYYNGIVFRGFIKGLADGILSGGRYDKLVEKMGKRAAAIGFALTLNELERLEPQAQEYDADVLLLYDDESDLTALWKTSQDLVAAGKRVLVQSDKAERMRARSVQSFVKEGK